MNRLMYDGMPRDEAAAAYEAWLLGKRPERGAIIACGPSLCAAPALPDIAAAAVEGEAGARTALDDPLRTEAALRNFRDWRRLPAGAAVGVSAEGLLVFPAEDFAIPEEAQPLVFPELLDEVCTDKELADGLGCTAKTVQKEAEADRFGPWAKRTPTGWLLVRRAAEAVYRGEEPPALPVNPLLLIFATAEAGVLWGRSAEEVRSAAAGAGHRAARLRDGERRRAGRTWLVTRAAMEKLYGDPLPAAWRSFVTAQQR